MTSRDGSVAAADRSSSNETSSASGSSQASAPVTATPRDPFALVGTTLAQKYVIESVAGEGGFSVVYRAMHLVWRRPVAIKAFKCFGATPEDDQSGFLEAFLREGALLSELSERSNAICQSRDVGTVVTPTGEWVPFLVLEWVDGESLEQILLRERNEGMAARSLGDSMRLIAPIADALAQAHERGVVHRDVKPANVLVVCEHPTPAVKLLDFGIAKVLQTRAERASQLPGEPARRAPPPSLVTSFTPAYGAPEQFSASYGPTGPHTDVFALALMLVELVSGKAALEGGDVAPLTLSATDRQKRPTPRARGVRLGDAIEDVFAQALAVSPRDRYASVGEFWTALEEAVNEDRRRAILTTARPRRHQQQEVSQPSLAPFAVAQHAHAQVLARHKKPTPAWALLLLGALLGAAATSRAGQNAAAMPIRAAASWIGSNDGAERAQTGAASAVDSRSQLSSADSLAVGAARTTAADVPRSATTNVPIAASASNAGNAAGATNAGDASDFRYSGRPARVNDYTTSSASSSN